MQDRQCSYKETIRSVRVAIVAMIQQYVLHILSVCVCVSVLFLPAMPITPFLRHVTFPSPGCLAPPFLPHCLTDGVTFGEITEGKKRCFDFLYNFCPKHFLVCEELSETSSNVYTGLHVKYPLFLSILIKL